MACPDCGCVVGTYRCVTSVETHGLECGPYETFTDEFIVCGECRGRFDLGEWDAAPEGVQPHGSDAGIGFCDTPIAERDITIGDPVHAAWPPGETLCGPGHFGSLRRERRLP